MSSSHRVSARDEEHDDEHDQEYEDEASHTQSSDEWLDALQQQGDEDEDDEGMFEAKKEGKNKEEKEKEKEKEKKRKKRSSIHPMYHLVNVRRLSIRQRHRVRSHHRADHIRVRRARRGLQRQPR